MKQVFPPVSCPTHTLWDFLISLNVPPTQVSYSKEPQFLQCGHGIIGVCMSIPLKWWIATFLEWSMSCFKLVHSWQEQSLKYVWAISFRLDRVYWSQLKFRDRCSQRRWRLMIYLTSEIYGLCHFIFVHFTSKFVDTFLLHLWFRRHINGTAISTSEYSG